MKSDDFRFLLKKMVLGSRERALRSFKNLYQALLGLIAEPNVPRSSSFNNTIVLQELLCYKKVGRSMIDVMETN